MSEDDFNACAAIVERGDPDRFLAAMAAKPAARQALFAIYAFNVEVARAPWVTQESMIAEMRLQWWRDALDEIRAGGIVRRHEVVTPLAHVLDERATGLLDDLVVARRWDIYRDPFEDMAAFEGYLEKTSGHLMLVAARALGAIEDQVALDVGYAMGLANWLRAIPVLEANKRVPLVDGRLEAVSELAKRGAQRLKRAQASRGKVDAAATQALFAAWEAKAILAQACRHPERVADGSLGQSEFAKRAGLTWRAMLGRW